MEQIIQIKPSDLKVALKTLIKAERPAFIWGSPGIGKSAICKQIADEMGFCNFVDIRLSMMDPTSMMGIPIPTNVDGNVCVQWSPPSFFTKKGRSFYLFDELNSAPPSIQAAAYQIILDKKLGEHSLNKDDYIIAAGNRDSDKGVTFKMPTPLLNRFVHLELVVDFDDWLSYAIENKFHPNVVGYLNQFKADLNKFDPMSSSKAFPTPRSWEFVSQLLYVATDVTDNIVQKLVAGAVGDGVAVKFMAARKLANKLPNPSDILSGKITNFNIEEKDSVAITYSLITSLVYELKMNYDKYVNKEISVSNWHTIFDRFLSFILDNNIGPEFVVMGVRFALNTFKIQVDPQKLKNWKRFAQEYADLVLGVN